MVSLSESYDYARRLTRARAKNFYYAFLLLPRERRRSIYAVYAFSRRADDAVDSVEQEGASEDQARGRLDALRRLLEGGPSEDPLAPALRDTVERYGIPRERFEDLLVGMEMDLERKEYETFDELYRYCYHVASVVGLISIEIFGHSGPEAYAPAEKLGIAMQLTNILRDVAEDLDRGRRYLPREDLERFGYCAEELRSRVADRRFRDLVKFEVGRARRYFEEARSLYPLIPRESRYCPALLARLYCRILDLIERQDYDVLSRRPSLPVSAKLCITARTWLDSLRGAI